MQIPREITLKVELLYKLALLSKPSLRLLIFLLTTHDRESGIAILSYTNFLDNCRHIRNTLQKDASVVMHRSDFTNARKQLVMLNIIESAGAPNLYKTNARLFNINDAQAIVNAKQTDADL